MKLKTIILGTAFCVLSCLNVLRADVTPAAMFSNGAVLQSDKPLPIWGTADAGEKVIATLNGQTTEATADTNGHWMLRLPAMPAGGPFVLQLKGKTTLDISDVMIGEVWLCSGQSNMEFKVEAAENAKAEIDAANDPLIRSFTVESNMAATPQSETKGNWKAAVPAGEASAKPNVASMSAVAYFFAKEMRKQPKFKNVAFGMINSSAGWTPAEAWTSREAMLANPALAEPIVGRWDFWFAQYPKAKAMYAEKLAAFQKEFAATEAANRPELIKPKKPLDPHFIHQASGMWNGKIAPLIPYALRGVLWYQGETNVERAEQYRTLFPTLIKDWRARWNEELPFLFVQLAAVGEAPEQPKETRWPELREAQLFTEQTVPNTGMAVAIDVNHDPKDVHPTNKPEIARRLSLVARARVYGEKELSHTGPRVKSSEVKGNTIHLTFTGTAGGLKTSDGKPPALFQIAAADKKWIWAEVKIEGDTVMVSSPNISAPVAVRYAWKDFPNSMSEAAKAVAAKEAAAAGKPAPPELPFANLIGADNLPASSFRTDDWDLMTKGYIGMYYTQFGMDDVTMTAP